MDNSGNRFALLNSGNRFALLLDDDEDVSALMEKVSLATKVAHPSPSLMDKSLKSSPVARLPSKPLPPAEYAKGGSRGNKYSSRNRNYGDNERRGRQDSRQSFDVNRNVSVAKDVVSEHGKTSNVSEKEENKCIPANFNEEHNDKIRRYTALLERRRLNHAITKIVCFFGDIFRSSKGISEGHKAWMRKECNLHLISEDSLSYVLMVAEYRERSFESLLQRLGAEVPQKPRFFIDKIPVNVTDSVIWTLRGELKALHKKLEEVRSRPLGFS
ncbi:hypothetical protein C5167_003728 [Papaver somniferum]|uniref:STM1-like N-terminal domain-containing protein n=1 Tax=Papaver somniferum TaxID=3469 RepID=A0A4Y7L4D8_PAPSO|nr:uncharacterized protein LOC113307596 [Papaver somniferum]XP_026411830.1 uncharacterized protein LOC113307596 [Papaver somniferum]XP_026411831.1 uncharacterized protein LOC113307596 [Papaver somniferum]XP_026411832.1 uncharacterized protein LOC113307596 [Papaver somniferum]RZC79500.1 hypothetical protein C5167_003728 [Papaver somniferum]